MKTNGHSRLASLLLGGAAACAILTAPALAADQLQHFNIPSQDAAMALNEYARQAGVQIVFPYDYVKGRQTPQVEGDLTRQEALAMLTSGLGLAVTSNSSGMITLRDAADPQSGSAAGDGADQGTVQALIVTAQKREENIQDVPIAISAFSEKSLQEQKIEGGFDLLKAIPNVTFSKNNFTSYNFSIRGIGTKAVSATTDPGVAVSFNNLALLQNRLFEQEYFDVERVEVLRGPQGTLYGRNATAGVINVISAKPNLQDFDGWVKGEVGNYHAKRASAMVNIPLIHDKLAVRFAGSLTDRQGYDFNEGTDHPVNGRDLWSARVTVAFRPIDRLRANVIWERFNENDDRSRTGKQLCYRDPGPTKIGNTDLYEEPSVFGSTVLDLNPRRRSVFSQGCKPGSLYDPMAFGTPNGLSLPFVLAADIPTDYGASGTIGIGLINWQVDPYGGMMQSNDLRVINSIKDPHYIAKADVVELNIDFDITDELTLYSQSLYDKDTTYSNQDYNRFNTVPIFTDTSAWANDSASYNDPFATLAPGGIFCDPQLGCSNKLVGYDIATAKGTQFGEELRLQSSFEGPFNFSLGANYTSFKTLVDYYVFYNLITAAAIQPPFNFAIADTGNRYDCNQPFGFLGGDPAQLCPYVDPNPLESINGEGHNYFRSKNPYKLSSAAAFGEVYWQATDALKVTAGLRYTDDRKTFIPVPSQVLLADGVIAGGDVGRGYPEQPAIKQHWGEWSGRLGVDWKPVLSFTDQTMLYAFYSRGYKGGGANPPAPGYGSKSFADYYPAVDDDITNILTAFGYPQYIDKAIARFHSPILHLTGVEYDRTFKPEFVNAFEVGAKNTMLGGALVANLDAFFYDYKDYQVSQIRDRTAVNENFNARVWGMELESLFSPSHNLRLNGSIGWLDTSIGDGEQSIDIMNRNQGNTDFTLVRSWVQLPSNCVVPTPVAENWAQHNGAGSQYWGMCGGTGTVLDYFNFLTSIISGAAIVDPATGTLYDPAYYNGQNGTVNIHGGAGIAADLSGKELPNAPHWTVTLGAQYSMDIADGWRATIRGDGYWQSQSWARVYNAVNDKLHGWYNANLSLWVENEDGLKIEIYAKNILDKTPITDAFINSDDTALTTNVFVLDPRLIGLSIRKEF